MEPKERRLLSSAPWTPTSFAICVSLTGGEPFMNPAFPAMLEEALRRGYWVLVLTNSMRPMMKMARPLLALKARFPRQLIVRVSLDHYSRSLHELERGPRSWDPAFAGLGWLIDNGFVVHVAGRRQRAR